MAAKKTYGEKLRDPRWQRKRLEIMNRDKFRCTICNSSSSELHVHHGYYERNLDPWEYDDDTLLTVCHACHEEAENVRVTLIKRIAKLGHGISCELERLCCVLQGIDSEIASDAVSQLTEVILQKLIYKVPENKRKRK